MYQLDGKVALVTGGANGIGLACVKALIKQGVKVSICDIQYKSKDNSVFKLLVKKYGSNNLTYFYCDVKDESIFKGCFIETKNKWGRLDIVFNNAGICQESRNWENTIQTNLVGTINGTELAVEHLTHGGIVVNIGSVSALISYPSLPVYTATKAAINHYSSAMVSDPRCVEKSLRIVTINPGPTLTRIFTKVFYQLTIPQMVADFLVMKNIEKYRWQRPKTMARGFIKVIENAQHGSMWTIQGGNNPVPITIQ